MMNGNTRANFEVFLDIARRFSVAFRETRVRYPTPYRHASDNARGLAWKGLGRVTTSKAVSIRQTWLGRVPGFYSHRHCALEPVLADVISDTSAGAMANFHVTSRAALKGDADQIKTTGRLPAETAQTGVVLDSLSNRAASLEIIIAAKTQASVLRRGIEHMGLGPRPGRGRTRDGIEPSRATRSAEKRPEVRGKFRLDVLMLARHS